MGNEQVKKQILKYWYLLEFLNQNEFPKIEDTKPNDNMNIMISHAIDSYNGVFSSILEDTKKYSQGVLSNNVDVCIGKISREACMKEIYALSKQEDDRIENTNGNIAVFGLQISTKKQYISKSFNLSPIIWVLNQLNNHPNQELDKIVDIKEYEKSIEIIEKWLIKHEIITDDILHMLFDKVSEVFLHTLPDLPTVIYEGAFFYQRFKDDVSKEKRDYPMGYSSLSLNFFASDLELMQAYMEQPVLNESCYYQTFVSPYITCLLDTKNRSDNRIDILKNTAEGKALYKEILHIKNAPLGKWPSQFYPCFMQQFAINLAIGNSDYTPAHVSVNGPPGTGKTTMLKEIIANTVVEKAIYLLNFEEANEAFEARNFKDGDCKNNGYNDVFNCYYKPDQKLSEFSILVTSSNNTAVENITKELPDGKGLCEGLLSHSDSAENDERLRGLYDAFSQSEEDVYFTKYAMNLFNDKKDTSEQQKYYWGLISAPLGKKENRSKLISVLYEIMNQELGNKSNYEERNQEFQKAKKEFNIQLNKVKEIQKKLSKACDAEKELTKYKLNIENNIRDLESKQEIHRTEVKKAQKNISSCKIVMQEEEKKRDLACERINEYEQAILKKDNSLSEASTSLESIIDHLKQLESARTFKDIICLLLHIKTLKQQEIEKLYNDKAAVEKAIESLNLDLENSHMERNQEVSTLKEIESKIQDYVKRMEILNASIAKHDEIINSLESEIEKCNQDIENKVNHYLAWANNMNKTSEDITSYTVLNESFLEQMYSEDVDISTEAHIKNPWLSEQYNRERELLFYKALQVNKHFIRSSSRVKANIKNLLMLWTNTDGRNSVHFSDRDRIYSYTYFMQTLFMLIPVLSSTFASIGSFLEDIKKPFVLGALIIDEAGQAQPHMALGSMIRCKKAVIVGDPKQVEPVVTDELNAVKHLMRNRIRTPYNNKSLSVQGFADELNRYGTYFNGEDGEQTWVGCPLVVHRRCISPMFEISNAIAYDNTMKQQTRGPSKAILETCSLSFSQWMNVSGNEVDTKRKNHYVKEQGVQAIRIISEAFRKAKGEMPSLFVISPFKSVKDEFKKVIEKDEFYKVYENKKQLDEWIKDNIGTVHTFQGKEANEVIFLLGCDENSNKSAEWVNKNMINVAVTRAKYRLCIIGDYAVWGKNPHMNIVKGMMDAYLIHCLKEYEEIEPCKETIQSLKKLSSIIKSCSIDLDKAEGMKYVYSFLNGMKNYNRNVNFDWLTNEEMKQYHLCRTDLKEMGNQARKLLVAAIKVNTELAGVMEKYNVEAMDYSFSQILFCKAIERHIRDCFIAGLRRHWPNYPLSGGKEIEIQGKGWGNRIEVLEDKAFMLGKVKEFLRTHVDEITDITKTTKYDQNWWFEYIDKIEQVGKMRNECCHPEFFTKEQAESLEKILFKESVFVESKAGKCLEGIKTECANVEINA